MRETQDSSSGLDIDRLGDRLAASSFPAGAARAGASASSLPSPTPSQAAKRGGGGNGDRRLHAGFSVCKEASPSSGTRTGEDDGYCGLGGVEGEALSDEEDAVETEAVDTQVGGEGGGGGIIPSVIRVTVMWLFYRLLVWWVREAVFLLTVVDHLIQG